MSFNFGGFAGGFSDGFGSGVRMGKTMRDIIREKKMQETLQNARDEAAAAYDASQAGKARSVSEGPSTEGASYKAESGAVVTPVRPAEVVSTGLPPIGQESPASAAIPPSVANQTPAAPGSGASAEGNAGEAEAKTAMVKPTPQQAASAGIAAPGPAKFTTTDGKAFDTRKDAEAAEKYGKHAETVAGKQAIKAWADAKSAPDIDTRAQRFGQYYTDHINDGVDYTGHKILTKEDGTQVAVVSLKDKQTGKTSEMELTDQKMVELGDAWNPAAVFKNEQGRAAAAAAQKAKTGEEVLKSNLRMREKAFEQDRIDAREGAKGRQTLSEISLRDQIERQNAGAKVTAELTAKTDALKAYGYTEEEIKPLVPLFLKVGEYKKMTDPAERRAIIGTELMKSDPTYSRATAEEQRARIDKAMAAIFGEAAPAQPGQPAPATPATSGVPPRPVYVRDKTTGQIFQIQGDKKIPVGPPPKPPAAPAAPVPPAGAQSAIPPSPAAMAAGGIPARGSGLNLVPR
jgi:hypothetical protein